jgi:hypothetical protein
MIMYMHFRMCVKRAKEAGRGVVKICLSVIEGGIMMNNRV